MEAEKITLIPVAKIKPSPVNKRNEMNVADLVDSIDKNNLSEQSAKVFTIEEIEKAFDAMVDEIGEEEADASREVWHQLAIRLTAIGAGKIK